MEIFMPIYWMLKGALMGAIPIVVIFIGIEIWLRKKRK